jgi:hypothetical protein
MVLKTMSLFIPVDLDQVKECQLCGQPILFIERREGGLWFPTDAIQDEENGGWGYQSRGSQKEVALLHKCYGDPKDLTTVNGRRSEYEVRAKGIQERLESLKRKHEIISTNIEANGEYKRLVDEYVQLREQFSDII